MAVVLSACSRPPTAVVVVVESDLRVPDELAAVAVQAGGAACVHDGCAHTFPIADAAGLPFSFSVVPSGDPSGPLTLSVLGVDGGGVTRVAREVSTRFVAEQTRVLHVTLTRSCLDHAGCTTGETCIAGACTSAVVDPSTLSELVPGTELDGSTLRDAGAMRDADTGPIPDVGTTEAGVDASLDGATDAGRDAAIDADHDAGRSTPASCADLPSGSAPGAYEIDPDGPGGVAPFLDYCETEADGGGWTLIAKVDPGTPDLAYGAAAWTASIGAATGTADLDVGNALYTSYWSLPVRELRFVVAPVGTPTATRTLVTSIVTPTTAEPLRMAMEQMHHLTLDAPRASWLALVGASSDPGTPVCELAGAPVVIPPNLPSAPSVRVRVGYVWADGDCSQPGFWAGLGADGRGCRPVASTAGGGRLCGTGAQRENIFLQVWLFGR